MWRSGLVRSSSRDERLRRVRRALLNEARRRVWVQYYLSHGLFECAADLGWDPGDLPHVQGVSSSYFQRRLHDCRYNRPRRVHAATYIQARVRGWLQRIRYEFHRDSVAHVQWVDYYVRTGQYANAKMLGWSPQLEREAAERVRTA